MLTLAAGAALTIGLQAPASADSPYDGLTFWSGAFTGESVDYAEPSASCTTLPFTVHSELNLTGTGINVYKTGDCTGPALTFPATDIHSFITFDGRSFRAAQ